MISERARGVLSLEAVWERCHSGKGVRDAESRALAEARQLAAQINDQLSAAWALQGALTALGGGES
jgi:hypothetical protein